MEIPLPHAASAASIGLGHWNNTGATSAGKRRMLQEKKNFLGKRKAARTQVYTA
jgi:hypothetical protein